MRPRFGIVYVSDRGDRYLPGCRRSLARCLPDQIGEATITEHVVDDRNHDLGMAGAVRAAWSWALDENVDFLLHVEEDFVFTAPVPLVDMAAILVVAPRLAQVTLLRQPWSNEERAAGGIYQANPDAYSEATWRHLHPRSDPQGWCVEHRRLFSLNPSLIPRRTLEVGWPDGNEAEFTQRCLDRGMSFAYYGRLSDRPRVHHVGSVRGEGWRL